MRPLDPEVPSLFRTAAGATYVREEAARALAPWARASAVATPAGPAILVELPREVLVPDVVGADRRARAARHVVTAAEIGTLTSASTGPSGPYRGAASASETQHYALFPALAGDNLTRALAAARAGQSLAPRVVATLAVEIAAALPGTEQLGMLRPESIIVSESGAAQLRGPLLEHIAAALAARTTVARPRLAYLAPEMVRTGKAHEMDARGRLFALGLMLTELATGRELLPEHPSAARLLADWSLKIPELPADAPGELRAVLWALLSRDPDRRVQPAMLIERLAPLYEPGVGVATALRITGEGGCPYF